MKSNRLRSAISLLVAILPCLTCCEHDVDIPLTSASAGLAAFPAYLLSSGLQIGVNVHTGGGSTTANDQVASVMANRNLRVARLDYVVNSDQTLVRDQIVKINANGGSAQLVVENSYQWDGSCNSNLVAVEQDSYNQTSQMVGAMKDIAHDFEVLNQVQLYPWINNEVPWNSAGTSTAPYAGKRCVASVTAAIRGATRAIHDHGQRATVGVIGRDFGWLSWLKQNNVAWDVTGYHIYPHYGDPSLASDPWFGTNGPLYQLALFGKPITINEFNCGEIYDSNYENTAGQPDTETCLKSVNKHLQEIRSYSGGQPIRSIVIYELLDEPSKAAPENHFGLMYALSNPKIELYLVTAFAGGTLTSTEQATITSRGLLTDAQIAGMSSGLQIGVNVHTGGGSTTANDQVASVMANRNLRVARLDYFVNSDQTLVRDQIVKINANGGSAQLVVENSYQWDGSCNSNLAAVEQDSYNQTSQMVGAMKDIAHDFEVLNEVQLYPWINNEVPWNSAGTSIAPYAGKPCVASVTAAIRGATRAIHDHGQRATIGVIGRDFGWLSWLKQNNVAWDVTGYHIYPHYGDPSLASDPWFGTNGPLYQLALFGKPITINEFNCGEIYDSNYENTAGQPDTETCLKSVNKHLQEIRSYSGGQPIRSIITYELLDEPSKAAPENHFGLMYALSNPKIELYLVTAFAGGTLTSTEQATITSRGLLTDAQIAGMK